MAATEKDYPPLLLEVFDVISGSLSINGIGDDQAHKAAIDAAEVLSNHWKGSTIYIPAGCQFKNSQRDKEIMRQFNGKNYNELAVKFGISHVWVRKIIKKMSGNK